MKSLLKPSLSTGLVGLFFFILVILALFAEVFVSRTPEIDLAQIYANPVPVSEFQRLKKISFTNKYGSFEMVNTNAEESLQGPWQLVSPQTQRVKPDLVSKIVENLNILRIRSIHRYEPINVTSFSLDNPNFTLFLTTSKSKDYEIKLGLINPIDNSAYLSLSSQNQIYQIEPLEMALETYDLSQIVESRVLALDFSKLKSVEMLEGTQSRFLISVGRESWVDGEEVLSESKVADFLSKIEDMKSSSLLENLSAEQVQNFQTQIQSSATVLKIAYNDEVKTYYFSEIRKSLPGLGAQFISQYLFSSDELKHFSVIKKDQTKFLQTTTKQLK